MRAVTELETFIAVVKEGGFSAAGRYLGLSPSVVAERIKALESRLGVPLLVRTTRTQSLTESGEEYFSDASRVLKDLKALEERVVERAGGVCGTLRVVAPYPLGTQVISSYIEAFAKRFPDAAVHLTLDDQFTDVIAEGIDIAIRGAPSLDSTFVGLQLLQTRRVVVASPSYLARRGIPRKPEDLAQHACLIFSANQRLGTEWRFGRGERAMKVPVVGTLASTCSALPVSWALAGAGLTQKSWWEVGAYIAAGQLVTVLDDFEPEHATFYAVVPVGRTRRRLVSEFVDGLATVFSTLDGGSIPHKSL